MQIARALWSMKHLNPNPTSHASMIYEAPSHLPSNPDPDPPICPLTARSQPPLPAPNHTIYSPAPPPPAPDTVPPEIGHRPRQMLHFRADETKVGAFSLPILSYALPYTSLLHTLPNTS